MFDTRLTLCKLDFMRCFQPRQLAAAEQAWYAAHPPKRGSWWKGTRPFVHRGFLRTWVANGLNRKIVDRMLRAVERMQDSPGKVKLYVTGACSAQRHVLLLLLFCATPTGVGSDPNHDSGACPST